MSDTPITPQTRLLHAGRGWRWLAAGWALFRVSPIGWLALVFGYYLLMSLIGLIPIPFLGMVIAMVLVPGLSMSFMVASRHAARGEAVRVPLLFSGLRAQTQKQLQLGVIYFVALMVLMAFTALSDQGALMQLFLEGKRPLAAGPEAQQLVSGLSLAALLYTPIMLLFWFAPALVAWHAMSVPKALFFSFFACIINWRAFLTYGLACILVLFLLPLAVLLSIVLITGGRVQPEVMGWMFPFLLSLLPTLFASFYVSYRDIFDDSPPSPASVDTPSTD